MDMATALVGFFGVLAGATISQAGTILGARERGDIEREARREQREHDAAVALTMASFKAVNLLNSLPQGLEGWEVHEPELREAEADLAQAKAAAVVLWNDDDANTAFETLSDALARFRRMLRVLSESKDQDANIEAMDVVIAGISQQMGRIPKAHETLVNRLHQLTLPQHETPQSRLTRLWPFGRQPRPLPASKAAESASKDTNTPPS